MGKIDKRVLELKKKKAQLEAQLMDLERRQKERNRKDDTRRKVLVGAYVLEMIEEDGKDITLNEAILRSELDRFLIRNNDRSLFGLEAKEKSDA
jgi:large subunit ribosomal protein L7/L12